MRRIEVNNKDHNYSEVKLESLQRGGSSVQNACDGELKAICKSGKSGAASCKETFGQVKDINELKKITPRVKLLTHDANSLNELTKISLHNKISAQKRRTIMEQTKQELKKYCRTCAGLKMPLVDIFSEKGNQMRLSQQIKHLEDINPYDSLSTQMCMDCICDLKMSYKFFMQIKKAEVKLKSIHITLTDTAARNLELNRRETIANSEKRIAEVESMLEYSATNSSTSKESKERDPKVSEVSVKCDSECPKIEPPGRPKIEPPGRPKIEPPGRPKIEPSGRPKIEPPERPKIEPPERPKIEPPERPKIKPLMERPKIQSPERPKIESPERPKIESPEECEKLEMIAEDVEIFEDSIVRQNSDDNESIEEFDPDDPPFQPDSSDVADSDDDVEIPNAKRRRVHQKESTAQCSQSIFLSDSNSASESKTLLDSSKTTTYNYDACLRTYVKVEDREGNNSHGLVKSEVACNSESTKECSKQPNILKRRLLLQTKKEWPEESDENACQSSVSDKTAGHKDFKVQKLDVNNSLNINSSEEDGIMYVTVKGSKPNEILLVKVKKMDKPMEKKDDKSTGKKSLDMKPMEKMLKRYETLATKEKDLFPERTKKSEIREQIIEEQIEEYKKKREKVLGGHANISLPIKLEEPQTPRYSKRESQDSQRSSFAQLENDSAANTNASASASANENENENENENANAELEKEEIEEESEGEGNITIEQDILEMVESAKEKSPMEKSYVNTEEYLARLAKLRLKWDEAKKKKESLQKELDESYTEGNMEKLARILGEKEKNLQDFQDYLKQRKIVITRLKDEDIISLYEDRNNAVLKNSLPDLIDESQPVDYIPEEHYLECDYCPKTFASREVLEEHLKSHDYKIMHFCEDCTEEFPTNKAKRNHNAICIKKLICKYCDAMLDSKGKKRQHEQKHCDSMYGQLCDVCGEKFKHQGTLDQHVKTQHMSWEKIYQCPKCPKKFAFKQKLSFHLKSVHTTLRAYLCEDCGADFKNPASLRHHRIRKHQPVGNKRECPVCHKLVPFYSLSKHMHTHKAYTIQCPHCDKMFKNSSTLKQHVRIHEDQRQYRCDTCGVGFNRRDGLRLHMRVHEKTDSRGLKECSCQVCGEKFPNHSTLVIHRNRVHKDGRQYTCHICNRSMISTRSLEWHMSHIHNESLPGVVKEEIDGPSEKKRASCYHCNKTFKTEMILRTHIKNTHMEKDPMKCLDCELTFTSEVRLRHHMMVTHNRLEGTLPCPHCPKRFVNQLRLKTHMISHSEERPYTCEICGFNLKTKIQLIKHHQNRHSDERPLQCRYCPWRCKQVSALVCHERTHTNERPYSCSVCRQRFKYLGDKNKHERRHESLGGSGFKRIVLGRNLKAKAPEDSSSSEHEQETLTNAEPQLVEGEYQEQTDQQFEEEQIVKFEEKQIVKFEEQEIVKFEEQEIVKFEEQEIVEEYEQVYEQEYEETSREASDAAEVIMNMEDTTVYTEEVTADNMEAEEMITDEMMTNEILQSGAVVHLQQEDGSGKIQVIPVMLSLPDLSDANTEVNLATASIMYNN